MRTPESPRRRPPLPLGGGIEPPLGVLAWNRIGFGPRPGDLEAFEQLGGDDDSRLTAFVDQQLDPASIDDGEAEARIAASGYSTLDKSLPQLWAHHVVAEPEWTDRIRPATETALAAFLRAVYSKRQLFEVMTGFWHDHFSVYAWSVYEAPTWVHYDRDVIRANALGNFRTLIEAVAKSTPMLVYLDNWLSSQDGPNENFAREFLELHALGGDAYYGAVSRSQVPVDGSGMQLGFVDEDVFAVARALTGWSLEGDPWWDLTTGDGGYYYRADWHDGGEKNVLGIVLPAGQPVEKDGLDVLDIVASHPATARHVCGKLCRRLVGDFPAVGLVDAAAQVFLDNVSAPDQIAKVVRTILLSSDFRQSWGQKVKRPFELVAGALRAMAADFPFIEGHLETSGFDWRFGHTGHYPFAWHPPNGYPDVAEAWVGTTPRVMCWRLANWLVDYDWNDEEWRIDLYAETPPEPRSANQLADYWIDRILGRPMPETERQEIVDFMAQGHNPDFDLPLDTDEDTRSRLQSMVGLVFLSPEFQWR